MTGLAHLQAVLHFQVHAMMAEQAMSSSQGFCNRLKRDDAVMADCGSHRSKKPYFFIFKTCNVGCTGTDSDENKEVQMTKL